jgi:hypothetical protein
MAKQNLAIVVFVGLCAAFALPGIADDSALHEEIDLLMAAATDGSIADRSSDAEFLRRVTLDLAGTVPSSAAARKFLADDDPDKRIKLVDQLLSSTDYPRRMQQALSVMLLERRAGTTISDQAWNAFVTNSFAKNIPWDQFVRGLISANGHNEQTRPAIRFFVDGGRNDHHQMTRDIARIFLGMDIQCAQCHDHPNVEDFRQADYFGLYAYLNQSVTKTDTQLKKLVLVETVAKGKVEFQSVFVPDEQHATGPRLPAGREIEIPQFAAGEELAEPAKDGLPGVPKFRPRVLLSNDLTAADNQRFVRNSVNRFWFLMMGRGLVHPLDMMHPGNPPSHPELLDLLAKQFVAGRFDVKHLIREIALSAVYQRSSLLPMNLESQDVAAETFRVARPRPLSAEQMMFSILQATGNLQQVLATPIPEQSSFTFKDYVNGRIPPPDNLIDIQKLFSATFGNSPGEAEVDFRPSVQQSLFLMNEQLILQWLKPQEGNLTDRLAKIGKPEAAAEELYLSILARLPDEDEQSIVMSYLQTHIDRRNPALAELAWSLLTSAEFRLNH